MRKTYMGKTSLGDFKVTTPENPLLSKQVVTSKRIPVPYTNLQLNPYPIPNWTCSVVTISHFHCTALSMWLINCADPSTRLNHEIEKNVGCKVFQFITWWRSRNSLVTKPYGVQTQQLLQEKYKLGQVLSLITICINKTFLHTCVTFDGPQNNPYICLGLWEKKA